MRTRLFVLAALTGLTGSLAGVPAVAAGDDDICPPVSAVAPKYIAPASIRDGLFDFENPETSGNLPPEDRFLFQFSGGRTDAPHREAFGYKRIHALGSDAYLSGWGGVHYRVVDPFSGVNLWFSVVPRTERVDQMGGTADGLFLRRVEVPKARSRPGDDPLVFSPVTAETSGGLRLLHFPIQAGKTYEDTSADVATKTTSVSVPGSGTLHSQSANVMTSVARIGGKDIFPVCDELAQAWKVVLEVRSVGEYRWTLVGTFWLGTHIGGWPIKEDFTFVSHDGKLISGSFASNLARLEPGDYL